MDSSGNGERGQQRLVFFIDPFNIRARERVGNFIKANQVAENRVGTVWWQNLKKNPQTLRDRINNKQVLICTNLSLKSMMLISENKKTF